MLFVIKFLLLTGVMFWILMILSGFYCVFKGMMLARWHKKNMYERWCELTTAETRFGKIGPGINNVKKSSEYMNSELDNEYEPVRRYKNSFKIGKRYVGLFFLASLVNIIIAVTLILMYKYK